MMSPTGVISISSDDGEGPSTTRSDKGKPKRKRHSEPVAKVEWSESDEGTWETFSKRRKGKVPQKATGRGTGRGETSTRTASSKGNGKNGRLDQKAVNDDSLSDRDAVESTLPEYLRIRRRDFDKGRDDYKVAGLRLPPSYDNIYFSDDDTRAKLEEKPRFDKRSGIKPCHEYKDIVMEHSAGIIPAPIAQFLRDYQIEGVKFLHHLFVYQIGGILGDDMGLGKTVQVAAFLTAAFGKSGDIRDAKRMRKFRRNRNDWYPRALIICPGSLTQNWKNELDRWGWWAVDLYHGAGKDDVLDSARAGRLEVMITTYTTYKNHCDHINRVQWDVVVADECHSIKDRAAGVTKAMNQVNAMCRIGLTGTAIQNRYEEFYVLLNWTNPDRFGSMTDWKRTISRPLTVGQSHDATEQQLREARTVAKKLVENLLPQFFLRRMKSLISHQLPRKSDRVVFCPLTDLQREAYENLLESPIVEFVRRSFQPCKCGSGKKGGWCCNKVTAEGESWQSLVFPIIVALQKLCSHFSLLIPQQAEVADKQKREMRFLEAAQPQRWTEFLRNRDNLLHLANPDFCGKWKVLRRLLKFWFEAGDKVLVFSHSVRLLRILQHLFSNTSYSVSYLDGSLSYEDRQTTVDDFNSDPNQFVFLISTKAGGVGLNITSANKVVIMDPHWNPAYDLQAQDRAYRIGQTRDVDVFRLISTGTIEEITYARQIYKQQQANIGYNASNERRYFKGVQQDSERKGEIFGIENLLSYHGDQVVLRDIVNKTNVAEARAGVQLSDINMDEAAKEEGGLSIKEETDADDTGGLKALSNMLTKPEGKPQTKTIEKATTSKTEDESIRAILAAAGVEYTHENSEVIGSSKVEDALSRRAQLATSQDIGDNRALFFDSQDAVGLVKFDCEYNPPEDVRQRQFCTMAEEFGFSSATDFALAVESMTQEQRRNTLEQFYEKRMAKLKISGGPEVAGIDKSEESPDELKTPLKKEFRPESRERDFVKDEQKADVLGKNVKSFDQVSDGETADDQSPVKPKVEALSFMKSEPGRELSQAPKLESRDTMMASVLTKASRQSIVWLSDEEGDDEL